MTDRSVAPPSPEDQPPDEPKTVEVEALVNMDDVLDGLAVALAHWNVVPGRLQPPPSAMIIGRLRYIPTILALAMIAMVLLNSIGQPHRRRYGCNG